MGYENLGTLTKPMYEYGESGGCRSLEDLWYHESWNWLMPVIIKCLKIGANVPVEKIYHSLHTQDLSFAYKSVVEFINEYKKENKL